MRKLLIFLMVIIGFALLTESCQYKFNIEPIIPPPDPTDTIYFSQDVLPIWNTNDKCTSCHKAGETAPDLTTNNAYSAVVPDYVNTDTPNESEIYTVTDPLSATHGWKKYSSSEAAIILQWIEQGAQNN